MENKMSYQYGLKVAEKFGLEWEFEYTYKDYRRSGSTEEQAVKYALYDWDILGPNEDESP